MNLNHNSTLPKFVISNQINNYPLLKHTINVLVQTKPPSFRKYKHYFMTYLKKSHQYLCVGSFRIIASIYLSH